MQQASTKPASILDKAKKSAFEHRITQDPRFALSEGSKFLADSGAVQKTMKKIAKKLGELDIPYAVVGGMALSGHGFLRVTVDVDILVTPESLKEIHQKLEGLGYLPPFTHSKNLRDTETGVKIEFLLTGGFPGDGLPKPVAFPDPAAVAVEKNGISYVNLPTLLELKLASGMTSTERLKDLADAQELIKILNLPQDFADHLNAYVRDKYVELWRGARPPQKRYLRPKDGLTADQCQAMLADGVAFDASREVFETSDPTIAAKYDMHDSSEFMN